MPEIFLRFCIFCSFTRSGGRREPFSSSRLQMRNKRIEQLAPGTYVLGNKGDIMRYSALPTDTVRALQSGGVDAYGHAPEHSISDGNGNPCRYCLRDIPKGAGMLILAHRPFQELHPYAETGPIFLCAAPCAQGGGTDIAEVLQTSPDYLVKGYSGDERIVYGTGATVPADQVTFHTNDIFQNPKVAYVHVRSARNNCYLLRIDRD
jgi:hypothetical protein